MFEDSVKEVFSDDPAMRCAGVYKLGKHTANPKARELLVTKLEDRDDMVRLMVVAALMPYVDDRVVRAALEKHAEDSDPAVRSLAILALAPADH